MKLLSLRLHGFRSYHQVLLTPPDGVTVLIGQNGAGKTNLLEAIHLCCLGRSHRTTTDSEMIRYGEETAAVQVRVMRADGTDEVGVRLYANQKRKKLLYINGKTASRMGELMGHVTCVMFSPEDLQIIKDGPAARRRFLDMLLSQHRPAYFYALQSYQTALRQRNALLHAISRGADKAQLRVWDEQLSTAAVPVVTLRREAAKRLDALARAHYDYIGQKENETLSLTYEGALAQSGDIKNDMLRGLEAAREDDLRRATTTFGPHRDDLNILLSEREIKSFGSQGQIRTAALSLRLAELDLLTEAHGEKPLLLLDDVLSELDSDRRRRLLSRIAGCQTFLTCTDRSDFIGATPAAVLQVKNGEIGE